MDGLFSFLSMGGYGAYVWPSYGLALLVMGGLFLQARRDLRHSEQRLLDLKQRDASQQGGRDGKDNPEASR
ncbi:heme exporter protein CcmD [Fodinicurvata fenggangensis]|uniref:heme exporter protein CcmD n=1 Tax=Fodinicurvata fenggangensis TaxID=1121830 RepID=UPI000553A18E|nr:heme exporter protein CcmD [Fodinicurvata fenggangensis]